MIVCVSMFATCTEERQCPVANVQQEGRRPGVPTGVQLYCPHFTELIGEGVLLANALVNLSGALH